MNEQQTGAAVADACVAIGVENERLACLIDELADALANLLHDTGHGVFARGFTATRQAEAALAKVRPTPSERSETCQTS